MDKGNKGEQESHSENNQEMED